MLILIIYSTFSYPNRGFIEISAILFILAMIWIVRDFILSMENFLEKIESFDKILENNPDDVVIWNNKGATLAKHREYKEAKRCFDKVLEFDPADSAALNNKGFVLNKLQKYKEALEYYDYALKLDPGFKIAKKAGKIILKE